MRRRKGKISGEPSGGQKSSRKVPLFVKTRKIALPTHSTHSARREFGKTDQLSVRWSGNKTPLNWSIALPCTKKKTTRLFCSTDVEEMKSLFGNPFFFFCTLCVRGNRKRRVQFGAHKLSDTMESKSEGTSSIQFT